MERGRLLFAAVRVPDARKRDYPTGSFAGKPVVQMNVPKNTTEHRQQGVPPGNNDQPDVLVR